MKIPKLLKVPETVTDQVMLVLVLILFGFSAAIISLGLQKQPIPPEFTAQAERLTIGVFAIFSYKKLSE